MTKTASVVALCLSCFLISSLSPPLSAQGPVTTARTSAKQRVFPFQDAWSPEIAWRAPDGFWSVGAHATLMPDGRILFIGYERDTEDPAAATVVRKAAFTMTPTPFWQLSPQEVTVSSLTEPVDFDGFISGTTYIDDDLFCSGNTLTSQGEYFSVGGTRAFWDLLTQDLVVVGMQYSTLYDGKTWSRLPADMLVVGALGFPARWYPSATRLPDERILVTGGYEVVVPTPAPNLSAEAYDPATGTWSIVSPFGEPPFEIFNGDYTHPVVLPSQVGTYDLLMFGQVGVPVLLSLNGPQRWTVSTQGRPGTLPGQAPNSGASSAPLPIRLVDGEWGYANGSMLIAGGENGTTHITSVDVYDPVADAWLPRIETNISRHHPTAVLLPTGQVAITAGHNFVGDLNVHRVTYVDPANGFKSWTSPADSGVMRGYHNVSLLLPDGRLLVGSGTGGAQSSGEKASFQYYYPPYMFGPRPGIVSAPTQISMGQLFPLFSNGAAPAEMVLMALGSMTHSFDFNQRSVQLEIVSTGPALGLHLSSVRAPVDARNAPPGFYMLFVLDETRTPSVASIVKLVD